jgi:ankyrin repeat protein
LDRLHEWNYYEPDSEKIIFGIQSNKKLKLLLCDLLLCDLLLCDLLLCVSNRISMYDRTEEKYRLQYKKEAETGATNIIHTLLEHKPDIYTENEYDFIGAIINEDYPVIKRHIEENQINVCVMGNFALKTSIKKQNILIIRLLIKNGADVNGICQDDYVFDYTFLMLAILLQNISIVKLLLENGADVNKCDELDHNSLMVAARSYPESSDTLDIIRLLLGCGVNLGHKEYTALSETITRGNANAFFLLLESGSDLNELTDINYLIKSMANLGNFTDRHLEILDLLLDKENDHDSKYLYEYARGNNIRAIKLLIEKYNCSDTNGLALIESAENGFYDLTKYLLENGADVHAEHNKALRLSSSKGHISVVKLLIDHDADVTDSDNDAINWAHIGGHSDIVKILRKMGALWDLMLS